MKNQVAMWSLTIHPVEGLMEKEEVEDYDLMVDESLEAEAVGEAMKQPACLGSSNLGSSKCKHPNMESKATPLFPGSQINKFNGSLV